MHSKLTKPLAAAIIIIAGFLSLTLFDKTVSKTYAMSDIPDLFNSANTLHVKGKIYFPDYPGTEPAKIEFWLDIENTRWRSITPSHTASNSKIIVWSTEQIFNGNRHVLSIDHFNKQCTFNQLSDFQKNLEIQHGRENLLRVICGPEKMLDTYRKKDIEIINGQTYEIWEGELNTDLMQTKMRTWLSPETGHMQKAIIWNSAGGNVWKLYCQLDVIELNQPIDKSVFRLTTPENYTAVNTIDSSQPQSMRKSVAGFGDVRVEQYLLYDLPENCLLMCWRNELLENPKTESRYFENLKFGGQLPKLPVEVHALTTKIGLRQYRWQGKHLAFTQKDGKFYEWSIYIPEKTPPKKPNRTYIYQIEYQKNIDDNSNVSMAKNPAIAIKDQVDFEKYVIEGIRYFSDNRDLPAPFTLKQVLELAQDK